jgi:hypothetical protein
MTVWMVPFAARNARLRPVRGAPRLREDRKAALRRFLDQPFVGFAPWILLSIVEGPDRLVLASALALALAIVVTVAGAMADMNLKLLEVTAIGFFAVLTVIAVASGPSTSRWLGVWSAELCNVAIAVITIGSIALRRPFTLQYARETTDPAQWESPLFLRINYVISAVWAAAFVLIAIVGYIGDGPLHQPDNVWTNWIIQIALVILAIKFTTWYPEYASAAARSAPASGPSRQRSLVALLRPLAAYLIPVGILMLVVDGNAWWIGATLIALGVLITRRLAETAAPEH